MAKLVAEWKIHKGKVQGALPEWDPARRAQGPLASAHWALEVARGAVHVALHKKSEQHDGLISGLKLFQGPMAVKTSRAYKKGELRLVPATTRVEKFLTGSK